MDRHIRYEVLTTEDPTDDVTEPAPPTYEPVYLTLVGPPVDEGAIRGNTEHTVLLENEEVPAVPAAPADPLSPPSYNIATSLPSYEEAEQSKKEEAEQRERDGVNSDDEQHREQAIRAVDRFSDTQLGTDGMFLCMFMIAFVFNWIGLLASLCISHNVAGRFGAISGFGLSMVKWVAIVKHNNWASGVAEGDSLIWWLLIVLGFLIFFRGCTQYIRIKYQWHRIGAQMRDQVYLLF